jgi:GT2 family glycosyltransferase
MPQTAIIVLNWNGLRDTPDCLVSLERLDCPDYEVIVVDNGSTDGSTGVIREQFPGVTLIENRENLGFTGGNNAGLRYALRRGMDYALLLNNDTEVAPDFLRHMLKTTEADPNVGIAGPMIYYHQQPDQIWSAGGAIDRPRGQTRMIGLDEQDIGQYGAAPREVDFVTGCALLVRKSVLEQVGLLDEQFFAYYEEVEWCERARRAGYHIVGVPRAKVWHKISPQARSDSPVVHYLMTRNRLLWIKESGLGSGVLWRVLVLDHLRTLVSWTVRPRWRHKRPQRDAMIKAIDDFFHRRFGAPQLGVRERE